MKIEDCYAKITHFHFYCSFHSKSLKEAISYSDSNDYRTCFGLDVSLPSRLRHSPVKIASENPAQFYYNSWRTEKIDHLKCCEQRERKGNRSRPGEPYKRTATDSAIILSYISLLDIINFIIKRSFFRQRASAINRGGIITCLSHAQFIIRAN